MFKKMMLHQQPHVTKISIFFLVALCVTQTMYAMQERNYNDFFIDYTGYKHISIIEYKKIDDKIVKRIWSSQPNGQGLSSFEEYDACLYNDNPMLPDPIISSSSCAYAALETQLVKKKLIYENKDYGLALCAHLMKMKQDISDAYMFLDALGQVTDNLHRPIDVQRAPNIIGTYAVDGSITVKMQPDGPSLSYKNRYIFG